MISIKFIDLNHSLVEKVRVIGISAEHDDYFRGSLDIPHAVLMTASNPHFSFGGGIDAKFVQHFPYYCQIKQMRGGGNERIGNIIFAITVDSTFRATKELIEAALVSAKDMITENETLVLSGIGTGIGGLSEEDFVDILRKFV